MREYNAARSFFPEEGYGNGEVLALPKSWLYSAHSDYFLSSDMFLSGLRHRTGSIFLVEIPSSIFSFFSSICLSWLQEPFLLPGLTEGTLPETVLETLGDRHDKRDEIDLICRNFVKARGFWHMPVYCLCYRQTKCGTSKAFG